MQDISYVAWLYMHFMKTQYGVYLKPPWSLRSASVKSVYNSPPNSFLIYNIMILSIPYGRIKVLHFLWVVIILHKVVEIFLHINSISVLRYSLMKFKYKSIKQISFLLHCLLWQNELYVNLIFIIKSSILIGKID